MLKLGVSYYGNRIPWRVREDLKVIREAGCNTILHTFSEQDFEFYADAVKQIVADSKAIGLEVWLDPWGVGQVFGGETYSSLIAKDLSVRQMSAQGQSLPMACPNQLNFREYLKGWIEAAAQIGPEVLFWDEPHFKIYPEPEPNADQKLWACRCTACERRFQEWAGQPMPDVMTLKVREFKEDCLVEFVRFLCDATAAKGMKAAVCMLPFENSSTVGDWERIAALPSVDIIGTDPYWRPHQPEVGKHVGRFAKRIAELSAKHHKQGQIWILNFNIPKGEEGTVREAIEAAYREGIRNFAAWSYFGAAYISIKAEDPQAVWETLSSCYKALARREG
jgi:hypothetical protein